MALVYGAIQDIKMYMHSIQLLLKMVLEILYKFVLTVLLIINVLYVMKIIGWPQTGLEVLSIFIFLPIPVSAENAILIVNAQLQKIGFPVPNAYQGTIIWKKSLLKIRVNVNFVIQMQVLGKDVQAAHGYLPHNQ